MSIDLSFTKDPKWIEERERQWVVHLGLLGDDFRKKEIATIKHYFFNGEKINGYGDDQSALLGLFPLATKEGWTYVYENLIRRPGTYKSELYRSFSGLAKSVGHEASLRYFDYYNGDAYVGEGVAPVKIRGKEVLYKLSFEKVAGLVCAQINLYLIGLTRSPLVYRLNYAFSVLEKIDEHWFESDPGTASILGQVFGFVFEYQPELEGDELKERQDFLKDFQQRLEDMDDNLAVKKLWEEVKQQNGAV